MPGAVFQKLPEAGFADLVEAHLVDLFCNGPFLQVVSARIVRREHRGVELFRVVAGFADTERALALDVVATNLSAQTEYQRIARFELVFARYGMREGGPLSERHQAADRRID